MPLPKDELEGLIGRIVEHVNDPVVVMDDLQALRNLNETDTTAPVGEVDWKAKHDDLLTKYKQRFTEAAYGDQNPKPAETKPTTPPTVGSLFKRIGGTKNAQNT